MSFELDKYDEEEQTTTKVQDSQDEIEDLLKEDIVCNQEDQVEVSEGVKVERKKKRKGYFYDLIFYVVMIVTIVYINPKFIMQRTIVDGSSMANTLYNGEHLMVEKISYRFDLLDRYDIIVFYPYGRDHEEYYVKRIIGLPGETIQIIDSDIYINGEMIEEDYGKDPITYPGIAKDTITLGEDEYFVLGDNREISKDSRYRDVGTVKKENIGGKAFLRVWPLDRFGTLDTSH